MKEPLDKQLYEVLACPNCKAKLKYTKSMDALQCPKIKSHRFPIIAGIPHLLPK